MVILNSRVKRRLELAFVFFYSKDIFEVTQSRLMMSLARMGSVIGLARSKDPVTSLKWTI